MEGPERPCLLPPVLSWPGLPPPCTPVLNLPPPAPQELLPSALPGSQALRLHQELVAGPAPPPLQCQHYGSHRRQAGQGQAGGGRGGEGRGWGGASEGLAQLGSLPCNTLDSLPSRSPWGEKEAGGEDYRNSPSTTSGLVPAPMSQEWVGGPRATWSGVWESWPIPSWCSLEEAGHPLCLWLVLHRPPI